MTQAKKKFLFESADPQEPGVQRRSRLRFKADPNTLAYAKPRKKLSGDVDSFVALVIDESHGGCRLALLDTAPIQEGDILDLEVGQLGLMTAEVRWRKAAGAAVCELGVRYLE